MAKVNVFILSIVVIASLSSLSHGQLLNDLPPISLGEARISGVLNCTSEADLSGPPISNQTVFLECAGSTTDLGRAVTDLNGAFKIVVSFVDTATFNDSICYVRVDTPGANCSAFPPDAVVKAAIEFIDFIKTSNGKGILNYAIGRFVGGIL